MLTKYAQRVQDVLAKAGSEFNVVEFPSSTRTANDAAASIGCSVAQIVKSLIFRTRTTGKPILVLVSGANRVNEAQIEHFLNEKIEKADADFVREVTGFAIGGVPPIGHLQPMQTFIDEDLLYHSELWAAAGTPNAVFKLSKDDLVSLTSGEIITIK